MGMHRKIIFGVALGWGLCGQSAPLSLKETVEHALKNSPSLATFDVQKRLAELEVADRRSGFLPSLDLDSSIGLLKTKPSYPQEPWTSGINLKLTETLYDNGKTFTLFSKAKVLREIAELTYRRERDKLILAVTELFYQFSSNKLLSDIKQDQLARIEKQFEKVGSRFRGGLITRRDYLRLKTEARSARIEQRQALNNVAKLSQELRKTIGDQTNILDFEPIDAKGLPNVAKTTAPSLEGTYDYRIDKRKVDAQKYDVTVSTLNYWPNLNVTMGAQYGNGNFINSGVPWRETESYNLNVGLNLTFNLWDWGLRRRDIERANANVTIADNTFHSTQLDMQNQLKSLMLDLETLKDNYGLSNELLSTQQEVFNMIQQDYQDGQVSYTDLIDSLTKLLNAKITYLQSHYDLAAAIAKYSYFEGNIYDVFFE